MGDFFKKAAALYVDGFREMTWGRILWVLIALKLIILFGVLRLFFFKPDMAGMTQEQKSETVAERLATPTPAQKEQKTILE